MTTTMAAPLRAAATRGPGRRPVLRRTTTFLAVLGSAAALALVGTGTAGATDHETCSGPVRVAEGYTMKVCIVVGDTAISATTKFYYNDGVAAGGDDSLLVTLCADNADCRTKKCPLNTEARGTTGVEQCTEYRPRLAEHHTYEASGKETYSDTVGPVKAFT